jgi:hypothetical protein
MKTAVEWYNSKIKLFENFVETKQISWKEYHKEKDNLIKLANAMFKKQIISAHCDGQSIEDTGGVLDAEPYYNETFKQQEQ